MLAGSVHVVMRHAIVECVNVVIGVHIVVHVVLLVGVRVVPIFVVMLQFISLVSHRFVSRSHFPRRFCCIGGKSVYTPRR